MKYIEKQGKTVEDAITNALVEMGLTSDQVVVEVVDEGPKGLFGLFSKKQAKVKVFRKENLDNVARKFLEDVFRDMNLVVDIKASLNDNNLDIHLSGESMGLLIGKRGQTLDALQYLVSLVVNKASNSYIRVKLDTENYRGKRKETLERLAFGIAKKAVKTGKKQFLEPMNPNDRRIIHSTLQNFKGVSTLSEGNEPFRKVVVVPNNSKNNNSKSNNSKNNKAKNNNNKKKNYNKNYNRKPKKKSE